MKPSPKIIPESYSEDDVNRHERIKAKLHALEKNISALCNSEMDNNHKKFVLAVLYDYKDSLLQRLESYDYGLH